MKNKCTSIGLFPLERISEERESLERVLERVTEDRVSGFAKNSMLITLNNSFYSNNWECLLQITDYVLYAILFKFKFIHFETIFVNLYLLLEKTH